MTSAFTKPSEAPSLRDVEEFDGLGRRRIIHPDHVGKPDPKKVSYTRVTTFISALEDSTALQKWRTRLTLEGLMDPEIDFQNSMLNAYEQSLNAEDEEAGAKQYRADVLEIADRAFHWAGGHDSADYGTALHDLAEAWHRDTLTGRQISATEAVWPGIRDDFRAYQAGYERFAAQTGAKIVMVEAMLVDDRVGLAGRTDLIVSARFPGDLRARRAIVDIKTGKIDSGLKLSQQLAKYAESKHYDMETGERRSLRLRQDVAVIVHVPRGEARAIFHLVQLAPGRAANLLCERVRTARRKVPGILRELEIGEAE